MTELDENAIADASRAYHAACRSLLWGGGILLVITLLLGDVTLVASRSNTVAAIASILWALPAVGLMVAGTGLRLQQGWAIPLGRVLAALYAVAASVVAFAGTALAVSDDPAAVFGLLLWVVVVGAFVQLFRQLGKARLLLRSASRGFEVLPPKSPR